MMRVINRQPSFHSICRLSFHSLSYTLGLSFRKTTTTMLVLISLSCITILLLLITDFRMHFPKEHTSVHVNVGTIASLMSSKISWSISQNDIIIIIYIITFYSSEWYVVWWLSATKAESENAWRGVSSSMIDIFSSKLGTLFSIVSILLSVGRSV